MSFIRILTPEIQELFDSIWLRLTEAEKTILQEINPIFQGITREDLRDKLSSSDIFQGLFSLTKRYLLHTTETAKTLYHLDSVFQEYLKNKFKVDQQ